MKHMQGFTTILGGTVYVIYGRFIEFPPIAKESSNVIPLRRVYSW